MATPKRWAYSRLVGNVGEELIRLVHNRYLIDVKRQYLLPDAVHSLYLLVYAPLFVLLKRTFIFSLYSLVEYKK